MAPRTEGVSLGSKVGRHSAPAARLLTFDLCRMVHEMSVDSPSQYCEVLTCESASWQTRGAGRGGGSRSVKAGSHNETSCCMLNDCIALHESREPSLALLPPILAHSIPRRRPQTPTFGLLPRPRSHPRRAIAWRRKSVETIRWVLRVSEMLEVRGCGGGGGVVGG